MTFESLIDKTDELKGESYLKRKVFAGGLLLVIITLFTSVVLFFQGQKLQVSSAPAVMVNQPYQVHFSKMISQKSIVDQAIYVTDENGEGECSHYSSRK